MNNVVLIGRLTRDPEFRYIASSGMAVATFSVAIDRPVGQGKEKQTDFPNVTAFGKTAELCEMYTAKGKMIAVQGRIQTGSYENKNGDKVYTTDIIADRVEFLEWKDKEETQQKVQTAPQATPAPQGFAAVDDDDIPF